MMVKCPECGKEASDSAELCPGCGYRLIGRENTVYCPRCRTQVIPEFRPRDTISRYCPICKRPVTGLVARKIFLVVFLVVFFGILAFVLYHFFLR